MLWPDFHRGSGPDSGGRGHHLSGEIYGLILVIFDPCNPKPAINPDWSKMKA